jgi:hypothetical protein
VFYAPFVGLVVFASVTLVQCGWNGSAWTLVAPRLLHASETYRVAREERDFSAHGAAMMAAEPCVL